MHRRRVGVDAGALALSTPRAGWGMSTPIVYPVPYTALPIHTLQRLARFNKLADYLTCNSWEGSALLDKSVLACSQGKNAHLSIVITPHFWDSKGGKNRHLVEGGAGDIHLNH